MGVMPISAVLLSWLLLHDSGRWATFVGLALVVAGVVIVARSDSHTQDGE